MLVKCRSTHTLHPFVMFLMVVIIALSTLESTQAQDKDKTVSVIELKGRQLITCKSRWHELRLPCDLEGKVKLPNNVVQKFFLEKLDAETKWTLDKETCDTLAKQVFQSLKVSSKQPETLTSWLGTSPAPNPLEMASSFTGEVISVDEKRIAKIRFKGVMLCTESGRVASRFGPNWWRSTWRLETTIESEFDLANRKLISIGLSAAGMIKGKYYGEGRVDLDEPFVATVSLNGGEIEPLTVEQIKVLKELIAQLSNASFAKREKAAEAIKKMGAGVVRPIQELLPSVEQAESRARLQQIIDDF